MTVISGKNAILATNAGIGFDIFDFGAQNVNASRNSAITIDGQTATWSNFSPKTGNFSLTDIGTAKVTEVSVNIIFRLIGSPLQYDQGAGMWDYR
uniref:Uncharacterized protein n=1 Tax=Moniliophthora roreri TaxID=221103 RepID=A0A0W0F350_MONRR